MGERVGKIAKVPEVKQSNSQVRRTKHLRSMDTPADRILFLQRTAGNQAVSRLMKSGALQAKLRIGQPGDVYEQEADRVADAVMRMPEPRVQRQPIEEEEEEQIQTKPVAAQITPLIQKQVEEEEEEQIQTKPVTAQITPLIQRQVEEEEEETLQSKPLANRITPLVQVQRQEEPEEEETLQAKPHVKKITPMVQRQIEPEGEITGELLSDALAPTPRRTRPSVSTDPNCPGYESGERPISHRELGHLNPDVERLAPDKLLVTDFGVGWRHVKRSTKSDPTLQAWLTTWESDGSYQLKIVGYSDCVGDEGINTDLRHVRASNVEALLGPGAKSRVSFRGMAALGNYVTGNSTPANRARNRGVIIEFKQEFEFPEEEIIVTPQYCGPDSVHWLVDQMNRNRDHPVIKTKREVRWPIWIPIFNLGWNYGALSGFRDLVKAGAPWDFKSNQKQWRSGPGKTCPTAQCDKTVFLCGKCFFYDVPGNIHYGYIGRMASIRVWFLKNRAAAAQKGGKDPTHDTAAIDIGIAMAEKGTTLCGEIAAHESELNREGTEGCGLCPKGS